MADSLAITGIGLVLPQKGGPIHFVSEITAPERFSVRALRRVSRIGQLALAAVDQAWTSSELVADSDTGLVFGTALADTHETSEFLRGMYDRGPKLAKPKHFQRSVHGAAAGELALLYGLTGYNLTVTQGVHSGDAALYAAALAVRSGRCERCLCVAADTLSSPLLLAHSVLGYKDVPVGEAAAAVVLEHPKDAVERGADILGTLHEGDLARTQAGPLTAIEDVGLCGAGGLIRAVVAVARQ